ncbi:MAG: hypothetical protein WDW38_011256 [Sanguina aurantia]
MSPPADPSLPSPYPPPQAGILIQNETDLAQHITAATGPSTTSLLLPATLTLTRALPPAASCIDASQGFAGNLTVTHSSFTGNGATDASQPYAPPVAVSCSGGASPLSCSIIIQDTLFDSNSGQEALAAGLSCNTTASSQGCSFRVARTSFTHNSLLGYGSSYATPYTSSNFAAVNVTAAALVIKATDTSAFSLEVDACSFVANTGAGLWVVQERPDSSGTLAGDISITGSSFTGHPALPGGLPAFTVFGARRVAMTNSVWRGNGMGAAALEMIQELLSMGNVTVVDNVANAVAMTSVDILMMDYDPSSVVITGSLFHNNTGSSSLVDSTVPDSPYQGAAAVNIDSHTNQGSMAVSVSNTNFTSNGGFLSPSALWVTSALVVDITGLVASDNIGGAVLLTSCQTATVSGSLFSGNHGNTGNYGTSPNAPTSPGGGGVTATFCDQVSLHDCVFLNNTALASGGAVFVLSISTLLNITSCRFDGNSAWTGYGGAVNGVSVSQLVMHDSHFTSNTAAAAGGALSLKGPADRVHISGCRFSNDTAGLLSGPGGWVQDPFADTLASYLAYPLYRGGGSLFLTEVTLLSIQGSQFHGCSAPHSQGGALRVRFSGAGLIQDCEFVGCTALSGGALSLSNMNMGSGEVFEVRNSSYTGNTAVAVPQAECPVSSCVPNDQQLVPGSGGAIQINGATLLLSGGCSFVSNSAQGRGGALFAELPFDTSYIQILPQSEDGSGVLGAVQPVTLAGVSYNLSVAFSNNTAQVSGGAIALRNYPLYMSSSVDATSDQPSPGAGLSYSLFQGNSAPTGGAVSAFQVSNAAFSRILLLDNAATPAAVGQVTTDEGGAGHGGAMCIVGGPGNSISMQAVTFSDNTAAFGGGVSLHASPSCSAALQVSGCFNVTVDADSSFSGNSVQGGAGGAIFWAHPGNLNIACGRQGRMQMAADSASGAVSGASIPCASWGGNTAAGYGPVIASTPFYLDPVQRTVLYYTSNQQLQLNVSVQDYYGQLVVGSSNATAAPAVVRLDSSNATGVVLGGLLEADGVAAFTGVRLRGVAGSTFNLSFSAVTQYRSLVSLELSFVTVRPCQLNEYLDPGTRDLCVNCSAGTYNLIPTNTICAACPAGATCSSACLGNATCQLSGLEYAGFIVPSGGMWHSSMFSDQVMACPNPASCTFAARQQRLQQLQVSVRNAYRQQQYLNAVGQAPQAPPSHPHRRRALSEQPASGQPHAQPRDTQHTPHTITTPLSPLALLIQSVAFQQSSRTLLQSAPPPSPLPPSPGPATPTGPPPPPQQTPALVATPSQSADALFLDVLFTSIALEVSEYSSAQCAAGYTGRLCASCASGYGSIDIATCVVCPSRAVNTLYYVLATLLTLVLLAFAMHASIQEAVKLQTEHFEEQERRLEEEERERARREQEDEGECEDEQQRLSSGQVSSAVIGNTMTRSLKGSSKLKLYTTSKKALTNFTSPTFSSASNPTYSAGPPTPFLNTTPALTAPPTAADAYRTQGIDAALVDIQLTSGAEQPDGGSAADGSFPAPSLRRHSAAPGPFPSARSMFSSLAQQRSIPEAEALLACESVAVAEMSQRASAPADQRQSTSPPGATPRPILAAERTARPATREDVTPNAMAQKGAPGDAAADEAGGLARARDRQQDEPGASKLPRSGATRCRLTRGCSIALSVIIRIFVSYIQVLGLLQNVPRIYPAGVRKFLQVVSQSTSAGAAVSLDCSLPDGGPASKATTRTLILALAPCYVALACWAGWTLRALFLYTRARCARPARSEDSIGSYWRQDYSQQCYQGSHLGLAMGLGVPGLALLAVGWPLFSAAWLYINTQKLYTDPDFTGMYAFVFEGYQPRYGWWESVVLLRKLSIAFLVVFLHVLSRQGLQVLIVSMVLGIALYLQVAHMPYENGYMNWLEFLSLSTCVTTIYFSLFFSASLRDAPLAIVTVLVILINAMTMCVFVWAMMRAGWHSMLQMLKLNAEARKVFALAAIVALDFNLLVLKVGRWIRAQRGQ